MGILKGMLASVGNLKSDIVKEMASLTHGSSHESTRSTEVQGLAGPSSGAGEVTLGSPRRERVGGSHARSGNPDRIENISQMVSDDVAGPEPCGPGVGTDKLGASVQDKSYLDTEMQSTESRKTCSRVGTGSQQLYRESRTAPMNDLSFSIAIKNSQL